MHKLLNKAQDQYKAQIQERRSAVITVDGKTVVADMKGKTKSFDQFLEDADMAVIDDAYRRAARIFSPDISRTYVDALAYQSADPDDPDAFEEALVEARVSVAALGLVTEIQRDFDLEAGNLAKVWLEKYKKLIKELSDGRQEAYRQIMEMSADPQDVDLVKPEAKFEPTKARDNDGEIDLPTYKNHLLCDDRGNYPAELNNWEVKVVETEMKRKGFKFWYRNPQQPGQSSLGIAYLSEDQYNVVRPDFIFFAVDTDENYVADIVDPHGIHLSDAIAKLRGLSEYAKTHKSSYRRIESVAEVKGKLRSLDLTRDDVREAIIAAKDAVSLYSGPLAGDYGW